MSATKHGPDNDCRDCRECPTCTGRGCTYDSRSEVYEMAPGVISCRCSTCMGEGVYCPNYDANLIAGQGAING